MPDIVPGGDFFAAPRMSPHPPHSSALAYGPPPAGAPPPIYGQPAGFGQPAVNHFGVVSPAGPVPPTDAWSGGAPPAHAGSDIGAYGGVPELVAVAYTLLAIFAIGGLLVAITYASFLSDTNSGLSSGNGLGGGVIWGGSGLLGSALVVALRKGSKGAQALATVLSGLWTLYWGYYALKVWSSVAGSSGVSGIFPATGTVGSIAMFVLLAMSGAVGVLLWTPSAKRHFE